MSRHAPAIPVNAKMYRHFAIITVAITACLAMFADGENRETVERAMAEKKYNSDLMKRERELTAQGKGGNTRRELVDKRRNKGSFGGEVGPHIPNSTNLTEAGSVAEDYAYVAPQPKIAAPAGYTGAGLGEMEDIVIPDSPPPGMTAEEFETLRQDLLRKKRKQQQARRAQAQGSDNIFDASKERSQTRKF